ncbi:Dam family site-specific DNA-(adenine-N6)-methyltransferase [Nocardioides sp. LS1]|uniref:DNA adenine methylase n=1 Tax=Nocardioides sp. LS1 TaxID=1027620 RepID=UPI000FFA9918|nr:Dam family site-specific DNA-(adenine-N6)-methyltransferase [Nocardioides sp. LS1]GCD92132.1 site-specific DNA-methyltransferase (adenine-specific) [Nocardioides sp. LS1]
MPNASLLRWVGGKVRYAPELARILASAKWARGSRYVEPFVGGASVYFALGPKRALLADANPDLVSFYQCVSDSAQAVYEIARGLSGRTSNAEFLDYRAEFNELQSGTRKAALFLYLNRTCFNGVWRVNRQGNFNVPFGSRELTMPELGAWLEVSASLKSADIQCSDWAATVNTVSKQDVVFIDPPYHQANSTESFARYTKGVFSEGDHRALAARVDALDALGCQILLTVSDSSLIRDLYPNFKISELGGWYTVGAKGSHLRSNEIVLRNFG